MPSVLSVFNFVFNDLIGSRPRSLHLFLILTLATAVADAHNDNDD